MTITGSPPNATEMTAELRMPPAVAEWLAEQDEPFEPLAVAEGIRQGVQRYRAERGQPKPKRGSHRLADAHARSLPEGWPYAAAVPLAELGVDGLFYDEHGVIRPVTNSGMRGHAARHSAAS